MVRIFITIVLLLLVIAVGGVIVVLALLRASLPKLDGEQRVPGLESPVKITSDRYGIPTIVAQSRLDATLALGYITARDRLWQIDILRRRAAGRLSEILGKRALWVSIGGNARSVLLVRRKPSSPISRKTKKRFSTATHRE